MTHTEERLWEQMLQKSFCPTEWFREGQSPHQEENDVGGIRAMWVYRRRSVFWEVGYYDPTGEWNQDSSYMTKEEASKKVHYLNGG